MLTVHAEEITKPTNHIPNTQNKTSNSYQQHILLRWKESFETDLSNAYGGMHALHILFKESICSIKNNLHIIK